MKIFGREKIIAVDLGQKTMQDLMNFPKKEKAGSEEYYLKNVFHENHIQMGVNGRNDNILHDFEYNPIRQEIRIYSRYKRYSFIIYGLILMMLIPLFNGDSSLAENKKLIGSTALLFSAFVITQIVSVRSASKELERELAIRLTPGAL